MKYLNVQIEFFDNYGIHLCTKIGKLKQYEFHPGIEGGSYDGFITIQFGKYTYFLGRNDNVKITVGTVCVDFRDKNFNWSIFKNNLDTEIILFNT